MIDMHCHIIPQVDDGSRSITQTFEMAKRASELGYTGIFATSHYIEHSNETNKKDLINSIDVINKMLKEKNINITLYQGNEAYFTPDLLELYKQDKICTLGNSRYILMEFPMTGLAFNMEQVVFSLINYGYIPIIAHPERYEFVDKDYKKLIPLINEGALLQGNIGSIMGVYGNSAKKNLIKLLKKNMISFFGTDSHNEYKIYDVYDKAVKKLEKVVGKEKMYKLLEENPKSVLENKDI